MKAKIAVDVINHLFLWHRKEKKLGSLVEPFFLVEPLKLINSSFTEQDLFQQISNILA